MKLIYNPLGLSLNLRDYCCNVLVIEDNYAFEQFIIHLNQQIKGKEGMFYSDEEKMTLFKRMSMVSSPFDLQISERDLQKKLYMNLMEEVETTSKLERFSDIHAQLIETMEELSIYYDFEIEYNDEFSVTSILKNLNVSLRPFEGSFCSKFIAFGDVMHKLLEKDYFVLCNCDVFLCQEDYIELEKWAKYNEITLLLLRNAKLLWPKECNEYIIDKDWCEIH